MIHTRMTAALVACGLLASASIVACGSDTASSPTTTSVAKTLPGAPPNLITDREITQQPAGSPGRALLQWAQAMQFSDVDGVAGLVSTKAVDGFGGARRLTSAVTRIGPSFARVDVVGSPPAGPATARVRASLSSYDANGKRVLFQPTTFRLAKTATGWRVDDLTLLTKTMRDFERLDRASR